jgi:hypothetical protein
MNIVSGIRLTDEQSDALAVLQLPDDHLLFISDETWNLLIKLPIPRWIIATIITRVARFVPGRYQRRWARRLRQHFGFEREDAHQLALATFGGMCIKLSKKW